MPIQLPQDDLRITYDGDTFKKESFLTPWLVDTKQSQENANWDLIFVVNHTSTLTETRVVVMRNRKDAVFNLQVIRFGQENNYTLELPPAITRGQEIAVVNRWLQSMLETMASREWSR